MLALQILDKLSTLPLDLFYCTAIPRMLAYCPESYAFQAWSTARNGDYQLDNNAQLASMLSFKLTWMAGRADLDGPNPGRATSPAGSADSAMPCSPVCLPSHSLSRTPTKGEGGTSQSSSTSSLFLQGTQPESLPSLCLMREAMVAEHLKMTASLMVRVRQALMMEILTVASAQMIKALAAASQAVKKHQTMRVPSRAV